MASVALLCTGISMLLMTIEDRAIPRYLDDRDNEQDD